MQLSNTFSIARPVQEVYDAFLDVERIATCMPGSQLLGHTGEDTYEGEVKVKVGPLGVVYTGEFTILEQDAEQHRLTMRAKGREKRGAGNADAHIVATLTEENGGTLVRLDTDLTVRGKVAQFGRGVIGEVTDSIMQTFAGNVEEMLLQGGTPAMATTAPAGATSTGSGSGATPSASPGAAEPAAAAAGQPEGTGDLDAWALVVRPVLKRHAGSIATVAFAGLAAYLGARTGSGRRPRSRRCY